MHVSLMELAPYRLSRRRELGRYAGKTEALERILDKDWGLAEALEDGAVRRIRSPGRNSCFYLSGRPLKPRLLGVRNPPITGGIFARRCSGCL